MQGRFISRLLMMIQTDNSDRQLDRDVDNAVMQSIVE